MIGDKFLKFIRSNWSCRKCGKKFHLYTLGFGEAICPECFEGEIPFLFPDMSYSLNRMLFKNYNIEISRTLKSGQQIACFC